MEGPGSPRSTQASDARTLPARYYTDPQVYRQEIEHIFGEHWFCAGRAEQISRPGNYFLRTIGDESLIILRAADGAPRAFYNVCRHRGTRLCETPEGTLPGTIQCPYHAWTYDLGGRLIGAPHMEGSPGFCREEHPLHRVPLETWEGHLFVNLAPDAGPLATRLGALEATFRPWGMADLRMGARTVYDVAANWKLIIQNYSECLHCPIIHPALQKLSHYLSGVNEPTRAAAMGGWMCLREGVETLSVDGQRRRAYLPALGAEQRGRVYYYAILPNLLLSLHPDYVMTHTLWPRGCDRTEIVCEWHFHPDERGRPDFRPDDVVDFWDLTNRQDWHVCELSQLGLKSRAYTPGPYSERELMLQEFDRWIAGLVPAPVERDGERLD